jgi:lipopolysaccharide/colanic/teichoic acid biosynthesis glycosyltransferase
MSLVTPRPPRSARFTPSRPLSVSRETYRLPHPGLERALPLAGSQSRYESVKRILDCVLAGLMLVVALPFMILFAALIRMTSRGPAIYAQTRWGIGERPFTLYKLRTMQHDCEKLTGPCWAVPNDPRVTFVGHLLRGMHLDELPQLWNVIRGDMSLIGPRPERPEIIIELESAIPQYAERRQIRPGLTGLAQLQLPPDTDISCVRRKLVYDLHYIGKASLWLDLRILVGTVFKVLGLPCLILPPIAVVSNLGDERVLKRTY